MASWIASALTARGRSSTPSSRSSSACPRPRHRLRSTGTDMLAELDDQLRVLSTTAERIGGHLVDLEADPTCTLLDAADLHGVSAARWSHAPGGPGRAVHLARPPDRPGARGGRPPRSPPRTRARP